MFLAGLAFGCAAPAPRTGDVAAQGVRENTAETRISERDRPRLEHDGEDGFTVTEVIRIGSDVRADYQRALVLLNREQLQAGIDLLEDVVARAPELTAPYIDLGIAYGDLGDQERAEHNLQAALLRAPNHPAALNEMGIVYRRTGRFEAARDSYERALDVHPSYHYALLNLGVLCDLFLEDLQCALQRYESYAELVVDDPHVEMWIADVRNRIGAAL
jgi:Flp pilus assembly protein TadD